MEHQITFPVLKDRQALNSIKCKSGSMGIYVCFKSQCQNYPFMCTQKACACKKDHQKCFKSLLEDFLQKLQRKVVDLSSLIQQNDKTIDLFIQKMVNQAARMKQAFRAQVQMKSKNLSFSKEQLQMLNSIQKNKVNNLKGKNFHQIYTKMEQEEKYQNLLNLKEEILQGTNIWKSLQNKFLLQLKNIQSNIKSNKYGLYSGRLFKDSKIVTSIEQNQNIKGFFSKKIKDVGILYRASENQFKIQNFKTNCINIPNTLTLIETQYRKKIGGFTPLIWKNVNNFECTPDTTNSTFIFSLTQNQKFGQINNRSGIENCQNIGPMFGNPNKDDLAISNSANNESSILNFNNAFQNPKFMQNNQQTKLKFNENPNNKESILIKEWQVWKITFQ